MRRWEETGEVYTLGKEKSFRNTGIATLLITVRIHKCVNPSVMTQITVVSISNPLLSATNEWTTTVKAMRAQSKNNCANDKQMESQTNHN